MAVVRCCVLMPLRQGCGRALASAQNRAVARRCAARPLRCSVLRAAGKLTARLRRSVQTVPASQSTKLAARAPASPVLLGRLDIRRRQGPPATLQHPRWCARWWHAATGAGRNGVSLSRPVCAAEDRSDAGAVGRRPTERGGSMQRRGSVAAEPPQPPRGARTAGHPARSAGQAVGPGQAHPVAAALSFAGCGQRPPCTAGRRSDTASTDAVEHKDR
jgi:hypothetical protein